MKAVFLDRDGVINKYPGNFEYVKSWEEFHFLPGVKPALKKLCASHFRLFIISNQAGVSKGIYSQKTLDLITQNLLGQLRKSRIMIEGVYYCTHRQEDNCSCRKPKTGLVKMAIAGLKKKGLNLQIKDSYFIGDSIRDIKTGKGVGLKTILVFSGRERPENKSNWETAPDFTARNFPEAAKIILKEGLR